MLISAVQGVNPLEKGLLLVCLKDVHECYLLNVKGDIIFYGRKIENYFVRRIK